MRVGKNSFIFPVGSKVLCFEPDPIKAKIIYQAKILEHKAISNENKTKKAIYQVHFQGWKDKWNREVNEDMLLADTTFNRRLKKEIEKVARRVKNKDARRERIDEILETAALIEDEKNFDWQQCPGAWTDAEETRRKSKIAIELNSQGVSSGESNDQVTFEHSDNQDDLSNEAIGRPEDDEIHLNFTPRLDLSDTLKLMLEYDYYTVNMGKSDNILQLPASPNIVDLLQTYVNNFPYSGLTVPPDSGGSDDNTSRELLDEYLEADRSPVLCAETCSGMRILFDFLVRDHLLYQREYAPHDKYFPSPSTSNKSNSKKSLPKLPLPSIRNRRSVRNQSQFSLDESHNHHLPESKEFDQFPDNATTSFPKRNKIELLPHEERLKDPDLPCLSYGAIHFLRLFVKLPEIISKMSLTLCRRAIVIRHLVLFLAYLEENRCQLFPDYLLDDGSINLDESQEVIMKFNKKTTSQKKSVKAQLTKPTLLKKKTKNSQPIKQTAKRKLRHR